MKIFNLYYFDPFTGKKLLKSKHSTFSSLKEAWLSKANRDYRLVATEEKSVDNLPTRPRNSYDQIY